MRIISLSGIDGSGKTTQLHLLYYYLRSKGYKVKYFWLRWFSALSYIPYAYAKLSKKTIVIHTRSKPVYIHKFWEDRILKKLYPYFFLFDLFLWYNLNKFAIKIDKIDFILIDRNFIDAIIDLIWEVRRIDFLNFILKKYLWNFFSESEIIILSVHPHAVVRRKNDIVSLSEIIFKWKCFKVFARHAGIKFIDTTGKTKFQVFEEILKSLFN